MGYSCGDREEIVAMGKKRRDKKKRKVREWHKVEQKGEEGERYSTGCLSGLCCCTHKDTGTKSWLLLLQKKLTH